MQDFNFRRPKLMALAVAGAMLGVPLTVVANPVISLSASYSLDGGLGGSSSNAIADPLAQNYALPGGSDFYLQKDSTTTNSSVFFHTYGSVGSPSYFGARASGQGTFSAQTGANYHAVVNNTTSGALNGSFSFTVDFGELGVFGSGTGVADLLLRIKINGAVVPVTQDHTTITYNNGTSTCVDNDFGVLGGYMTCSAPDANSASASGNSYILPFSIAAGSSLTLDYDIISTVSGQLDAFSGITNCNFYATREYGGEGGDPPPAEAPSNCVNFNAIARSGDPPGFALDNTSTADLRLNVPEPGSMALVALALAGVAASRRRRQRPRE
jgi:hypothetical protein